MYAVIRTGGKQYRVSQDDVLRVESLKAEVGSSVKFEVLAIGEGESLRVGTPVVADANVTGTVVRHARARKVTVYKFRPKNYSRKRGHRQAFTEVRISIA
ncbi:MAG: 50S ribosomal protein L21 [Proteobacteria bacterium]|nr:50S ribosomal protein L21 [Pseudomonadota bacterium]MBQ4359264.1 50S ribosomal protein L21 [Pseudomonadota bacterium]